MIVGAEKALGNSWDCEILPNCYIFPCAKQREVDVTLKVSYYLINDHLLKKPVLIQIFPGLSSKYLSLWCPEQFGRLVCIKSIFSTATCKVTAPITWFRGRCIPWKWPHSLPYSTLCLCHPSNMEAQYNDKAYLLRCICTFRRPSQAGWLFVDP